MDKKRSVYDLKYYSTANKKQGFYIKRFEKSEICEENRTTLF